MAQMKKLYEALVEKAREEEAPDGDEETYHTGFQDGAIAFARQLCNQLGIDYLKEEDD